MTRLKTPEDVLVKTAGFSFCMWRLRPMIVCGKRQCFCADMWSDAPKFSQFKNWGMTCSKNILDEL
jgi:hypothetical protein